MIEGFVGFLTGAGLAVLGLIFALYQREAEKRDEKRQAAAAFRFELESNLGWLDDLFESRNHLRDEAWVRMKNEGYVSYLPYPVPLKVITVYDLLHRLNGQIRVLRESQDNGSSEFDKKKAEADRQVLRREIVELVALFDAKYPEIAKNFRKR